MQSLETTTTTVDFHDLVTPLSSYILPAGLLGVAAVLTIIYLTIRSPLPWKAKTLRGVTFSMLAIVTIVAGLTALNYGHIHSEQESAATSAEYLPDRQRLVTQAIENTWDVTLPMEKLTPAQVTDEDQPVAAILNSTGQPSACTADMSPNPAAATHAVDITLWCDGWPAPTKN